MDALARHYMINAVEATYFDALHLIIQAPICTPVWAECDVSNLGVYGLADDSDELRVYKRPSGPPVPDRRGQLRAPRILSRVRLKGPFHP
jgi:hypothetical protein